MVAYLDESPSGAPNYSTPQAKREGIGRMRLTSVTETVPAVHYGDATARTNHDLAPCPICGQTGAREWLRGPDRFHGRQEKYTLVRCPGCSLVWLSHPPQPKE